MESKKGVRTRMVRREWLAGVVLLIAAGCNQFDQVGSWGRKPDGPVKRLPAKSVPYLNGVPVPSGFTMSERLTDAYESGGVRFARQEYVGFADREEIREFYKEQMPVLGWREISSHDIKGRISMRFETASEECTLTIESAGMFNRSVIQVVVKPFNRNTAEPPIRRPMP
jgi:hypothetical protein